MFFLPFNVDVIDDVCQCMYVMRTGDGRGRSGGEVLDNIRSRYSASKSWHHCGVRDRYIMPTSFDLANEGDSGTLSTKMHR
jgi:hypothetical protein